MISFQPGPSQLWAQTKEWFEEGLQNGFFSTYHRSDFFAEIYQNIVTLFRQKLDLPEGHSLYFVSSATECWEILAQNFSGNGLHVTDGRTGAFAIKWANYAQKMGISVYDSQPQGQMLDYIAYTQMETSTGRYITISKEEYLSWENCTSRTLFFNDATSCMGGAKIAWEMLDVCFASVQKCFGLPPGMAVLIVSPKALQTCKPTPFYNDLLLLEKNFKSFQTTHTPNLINIWLLYKSLQHRDTIQNIATNLRERSLQLIKIIQAKRWERLFEPILEEVESQQFSTVLAIKSDNPEKIIHDASLEGILLGSGYSQYKKNSFRIANFPAISNEQWDLLCDFIKNY